MTQYAVELGRGNVPLAAAEAIGATEAIGGRGTSDPMPARHVIGVELPPGTEPKALGGRLALARRILQPWSERTAPELLDRFEREGSQGLSMEIRPLSRGTSPLLSPVVDGFARGYVRAGGRVDLRHPERQFVVHPRDESHWWVAEQAALVDASAFAVRRMPRLPFQRPVSLPPRLGRVVVNLARVRPGDRVVDPFVGTGALLIEAALLGARVAGVDRDAEMVRGALENFAHLSLDFERLRVGDAGEPEETPQSIDAIVSDPPYGRSSGSGGEVPADLLRRTLPRWADRVRPGGRVVLVVPGGEDPLRPPWRRMASIPDRVHRSLTREFRVYERQEEASRS